MIMHPAYLETQFICDGGDPDWPPVFAIITAYATTGETWAEEQNEAADQALKAELGSTGRWLWRVTGYTPTTTHREPGWAVAMDRDEACDVGARFLQDAIYVINRNALAVTYCVERRGLVHVGSFQERVTQS